MRPMRRIFNGVVATLLALAASGSSIAVLPVAAAPAPPCTVANTYVIGVDNANPSGKNWEFPDYYPRTGTMVNRGACLDFKWNSSAGPDSAHSATLMKTGDVKNYFVAPDGDNGAGQYLGQIQLFGPQNITCGDVNTPCTYDGSATVDSGIFSNIPTPPAPATQPEFVAKIGPNTPTDTTYTFYCHLHPGMEGSITVTAGTATDPTTVNPLATDPTNPSYVAELASATTLESNAIASYNSTGVVTSGVGGSHVEVLEMLPSTISIHPGDSRTIKTQTLVEAHTQTFPQGQQDNTFSPLCEGAGTTDTPPTAGPPGFGCSPPPPEFAIDPNLEGTNTISTPTTFGAHLVVSGAYTDLTAGSGAVDNQSWTFPNAGTFTYGCTIHNHMTGTIQVLAAATAPAATPSLPKAGVNTRVPARPAPLSDPMLLALALAAIVALAGGAGLTIRRDS